MDWGCLDILEGQLVYFTKLSRFMIASHSYIAVTDWHGPLSRRLTTSLSPSLKG